LVNIKWLNGFEPNIKLCGGGAAPATTAGEKSSQEQTQGEN
jgi:hypothetical protein